MKPLERSLSLILIGTLVISLLFSCNLLGSSENEGPRLTELPGKIVYSAEQGNETHLFITDQEGTRQLTSAEELEERDYYASNPSFSPDGQWVVYASNRASAWMESLYRVRTDGSEREPLKDASGELIVGNNPVFSPDGKQVAFNRAEMYEPAYHNEDIYVMELASGEVRKLTENTAHDTHPTWNPDGQRIAFASGRDYVDADSMRWRKDLYVINADGTSLKRLTETGKATRPAWGPGGNRIVYEWNIQVNEVFCYQVSSGLIKTIETGLEFAGGGIWNNDGTQLLVSGRKTNDAQPEIRLLNIENEPPDILRIEHITGKDYDWFD